MLGLGRQAEPGILRLEDPRSALRQSDAAAALPVAGAPSPIRVLPPIGTKYRRIVGTPSAIVSSESS
jgi:hypothetical protein